MNEFSEQGTPEPHIIRMLRGESDLQAGDTYGQGPPRLILNRSGWRERRGRASNITRPRKRRPKNNRKGRGRK